MAVSSTVWWSLDVFRADLHPTWSDTSQNSDGYTCSQASWSGSVAAPVVHGSRAWKQWGRAHSSYPGPWRPRRPRQGGHDDGDGRRGHLCRTRHPGLHLRPARRVKVLQTPSRCDTTCNPGWVAGNHPAWC